MIHHGIFLISIYLIILSIWIDSKLVNSNSIDITDQNGIISQLNNLYFSPIINSKQGYFQCKNISISRVSSDYITCCRIIDYIDDKKMKFEINQNRSIEIKCFPTFIIGGTPKSGTTVLAGLLASHPDVIFSKLKEINYFDMTHKTNITEMYDYFSSFPSWNYSDKEIWRSIPRYGEASPFYVSSRVACKKLSETIPNVKIIVMLRNPVLRAYSEYQMKKRRVQAQNSFIHLVSKHAQKVHSCLLSPVFKRWKDIMKCIPSNITSNSHWFKFVRIFTDAENLKHIMKQPINKRARQWTTAIRQCFSDFPETGNFVPVNRRLQVYLSNDSIGTQVDQYHRKLISEIYFQPKGCLRTASTETVNNINASFFNEISKFQQCIGSPSNLNLVTLHSELLRCIPRVYGGISNQYFYRSLYISHFLDCFTYIPRKQFMIISTEEFRSNSKEILREIFEFIGVRILDIEALNGVNQLIESKFPTFEKATGWKLHGDYEAISSHLYEYLQEFYKPYNLMLEELLNKNFTSNWETRIF